MRSRLIITLLAIFSVVVVVVAIYSQRDDFKKILEISYEWLLLLGTAVFINLIAQAYCAQVVTRISGVNIPYREAFGLKILQLCTNYIIPFGGWGFRAFYLKKAHNLEYKYYTAGIAGKFICEMMVYSILGILFLAVSLGSKLEAASSLLLILLGTFLFVLLVFLVPEKLRRFSRLNRITDVWRSISSNRRNVGWLLFVNFVEYLTFALTFYVAAAAYHIHIAPAFPFVSTSLSNLSLYIRLAPGALGTYEAFTYLSSNYYGISLADSLVITTILRSTLVFFFMILTPPFAISFAKKSQLKVSNLFYRSKDK